MDKNLVSQMKDLVEAGRKKGAILPVSEAFDAFPVEDEPHKGKIEYWQQGAKR
jgi:predicted secreted protein